METFWRRSLVTWSYHDWDDMKDNGAYRAGYSISVGQELTITDWRVTWPWLSCTNLLQHSFCSKTTAVSFQTWYRLVHLSIMLHPALLALYLQWKCLSITSYSVIMVRQVCCRLTLSFGDNHAVWQSTGLKFIDVSRSCEANFQLAARSTIRSAQAKFKVRPMKQWRTLWAAESSFLLIVPRVPKLKLAERYFNSWAPQV